MVRSLCPSKVWSVSLPEPLPWYQKGRRVKVTTRVVSGSTEKVAAALHAWPVSRSRPLRRVQKAWNSPIGAQRQVDHNG